jgi:hypothetical protein
MSGKKAKQERKQLRDQGILDLSTRAGRKRLRQIQAIEAAQAEMERIQDEAARWDALTDEEKWAERHAKEEEPRRRLREFRGIIGIIGSFPIPMPIPAIERASYPPHQKRGRR